MAYTPATAETLKARFPVFADVEDDTITAALTRARRIVTSKWIEDDRQEGEHLLAAHDMTLDGLGATRDAQLQGFRRLKLGSLELERESNAGGGSTTYNLTTFGQRFRDLLRRNHPPVIAIGE